MCKHDPDSSGTPCPDGQAVCSVENTECTMPAGEVVDPQRPCAPVEDDGLGMADKSAQPPGTSNIARPWPPRIYDFLTWGSDHYAADAEFGRQLFEAAPWLQASMWINKVHRTKAALVLAQDLGITQFIDLGCGYPSHWGTTGGSGLQRGREYIPPHTFDVVRTVHENARVMYADIDDYVFGHAKTTLDEYPGTKAMQADARDIPALLARDEIIDFLDLGRPIGVILHDVLPWLTCDEAALTMRHLHELLAAGSAVSVTHATGDEDPKAMAALVQRYAEVGIAYRPRTLTEVADLLGPWNVLDPGIQQTARWRDGQPPHIPQRLRTTWRLPPSDSHAYAAVTAPKMTFPETAAIIDLRRTEPPRAPNLLVSAALKALREQKDISTDCLAESMVTTSRAIGLWETGSNQLAQHASRVLRRLGMGTQYQLMLNGAIGYSAPVYESRALLEQALTRMNATEKKPLDRQAIAPHRPIVGRTAYGSGAH
ncbi:SAM-dependent methyltransferase [Streptomyces goshikiensis]|uniref:SAM-dependent methyltransferase n=1 Tax=Streptomyces goshikiensis TaxID=1942 RepID=UPI0036BEED8A